MTINAKILAMKDKKEQDYHLMKMLSMNLWRRVNAGYNIPKAKPMSQFKSDFPDDPLLKAPQPKTFNRLRDSLTDISEAIFKYDMMCPKPRIVPPPFKPQHIKIAEMKKRIAENKANYLAALNKVGALPRAKAKK